MLYYNINYQTKDHIDEGKYIPNIIMLPTGLDRATAFNRIKKNWIVQFDRLLMDPQLYFLDLRFPAGTRPIDPDINKIASYPWFGIGPSDWNSGQLRSSTEGILEQSAETKWNNRVPLEKRSWSTVVEQAVAFQINVDCDDIILPAPLIEDPASSLNDEIDRLREALEITKRLNASGLPVYASIPLSDLTFAHSPNPKMVNGLVDGFSAAPGLHGVYIPFVQQTPKPLDRITDPNAVEGLLRLARLFSQCTDLKIVFNFIESLGIVCQALGGHGYATGPSMAQRQCSPHNFTESIAIAKPKFFSLTMCADFSPEPEMEWAQKANQLDAFKNDRTEASENLFKALDRGLPIAGNVPEWDPGIHSNLSATRRHYFEQQVKAQSQINDAVAAQDWLHNAEMTHDYLEGDCRRVEGAKWRGTKSNPGKEKVFEKQPIHVRVWKEALERVLAESIC